MQEKGLDKINSQKDINVDFDLLIEDGVVGFYNRCEIIEIFGIKEKDVFNIFTLMTLEKSKDTYEINEYLTDKLKKFSGNNDIKWGICRHIVSIDRCKKIYENLYKSELNISGSKSKTGKLTLQRKQYISPNTSLEKIQLNNILKNNFHNGSYIIEAFDVEKDNLKFIIENPVLLNKFSEDISEIIPIRIGSLSDRLGNIIIQFPISIFKTEISLVKPDKGFNLMLKYDENIKQIPCLKIIAFNKFENLILDFKSCHIEKEASIEMSTSKDVDIKIINPNNNLILYSNSFTTLKGFDFTAEIESNQDRIFEINGELQRIKVKYLDKSSKLKNTDKDIDKWIFNRKYEEELKSLEEKKSFIQYYGNVINDNEKAVNDVRGLIEKYGREGVFLWDPYLDVEDVKKILYYTPYSNVPLKAITNLKNIQGYSKSEVIGKMKAEFEKDNSEYLFMSLEVRSKFGNHGWDFHDRFIIFPLERPKVWSLGISVNQLGKSHHILQEVRNAQHILNAFNKLWNELEGDECLVWKSI